MLQGVYTAVRKDGTIYYRSNITYKSKHISLGSFDSELSASRAYATASTILLKETNSIEDSYFHTHALAFDKIVTLINFRDNGMYIKTPIYLRKNYFSYYLDISHELKFDIDDLFYYSEHRILKRHNIKKTTIHIIIFKHHINQYSCPVCQYNFLSKTPAYSLKAILHIL